MNSIEIYATITRKVAFASHQNSVPIIRDLAIHNVSETDFESLTLIASSDPGFTATKRWDIDRIKSGDRMHINELDIAISGEYMLGLTESISGEIRFSLSHSEVKGSSEIVSISQPVELLAHNEWGGIGFMPELLAAFCIGNDPAVDRLLKSAGTILRHAGKSSNIDGYASGHRQRVWEIVSAIWSALTSLELAYALPPVSFDTNGQKVRLPSQIVDAGRATCLDLALFSAAAIEQAGLNPIVVFTKGHAFVGVWLQPEHFSNLFVDDASTLRNRIDLMDVLVFETTLATSSSTPTFSKAIDAAKEQISEKREQEFIIAVDIGRARMQGIKPLGSKASQPRGVLEEGSAQNSIKLESAPGELPDFDAPLDEATNEESPDTRLNRWQKKLLDLSLRNRLLNFRATKKSVKVLCTDPCALEDLLALGKSIKIKPSPTMERIDGRSDALHYQRTGEHMIEEFVKKALKNKELIVDLSKEELDKRLIELYRTARNELQEGGANTLFLVFGFLVWKRDAKSDTKYRAPLIMIPVTLERQSVRGGIKLKLHDDEPKFNATLLEMLRQDFSMHIKGLNDDLPKDIHGVDIASIWNKIRQEIKEIEGFEVVEDVILGLFSFAKYLMWKDLVDRTDELRESPVVRHLIDTPRDSYPKGSGFPSTETLDRDYSPRDIITPLDADSSQISAVLACAKGQDFVLIGPPGTGKSQTIANMIAHNLAKGRKVLFVSEKIAALEVVYRRLEKIGLGRFCLELHSNKARKIAILNQLREAWEGDSSINPDGYKKVGADRLQKRRDTLNKYVERLHHRYENGMTPYSAIGRVMQNEEAPEISFTWQSPDTHTYGEIEKMEDIARHIDIIGREVGEFSANSLNIVRNSNWSSKWRDDLIGCCSKILQTVEALTQRVSEISPVFEIALKELNYSDFTALAYLAKLSQIIEPLTKHKSEVLSVFGIALKELSYSDFTPLAILAEAMPGYFGKRVGYAISVEGEKTIAALDAACKALGKYREKELKLSASYKKHEGQNLDYIDGAEGERIIAALDAACKALGKYREEELKLSVSYKRHVWKNLDIDGLQSRWKAVGRWPFNIFEKRSIKKEFIAKSGAGGNPDIASDLSIFAKLKTLGRELDMLEDKASGAPVWNGFNTNIKGAEDNLRDARELRSAILTFEQSTKGIIRELAMLEGKASVAPVWNGFDTNIKDAEDNLRDAKELRNYILTFEQSTNDRIKIRSQITRMIENGSLQEDDHTARICRDFSRIWEEFQEGFRDFSSLLTFDSNTNSIINIPSSIERMVEKGTLQEAAHTARVCRDLPRIWEEFQKGLETFSSLAGIEDFDRLVKGKSKDWLSNVSEALSGIKQNKDKLRDWCAWNKVRKEAVTFGLQELIRSVEEGKIAIGETERTFKTNYARWWIKSVEDTDSVIREFIPVEHEATIEEFRRLDDDFAETTQRYVKARLIDNLPSKENIVRKSELGILKRELEKKRRHKPIRKLFTEIPNVLTDLTPCLLMSPLSIAQYLPSGHAKFDVVIFDEASQITTWDAIGALARAKQAVIVGDPKQLPPTSFFNRADEEADEEVDIEDDLESILDECLGASIPEQKIRWHYRSKHESLIAFSNHRYYNGGLITLPSPATEDTSVKFHFVENAAYERSGNRFNKVEAAAVVAEVVTRLENQIDSGHTESIGVVTFNQQQQRLIEDILDAERSKSPKLEKFFSDDFYEPVFVKNIESVQGDERDVMLFSLTYGPNKDKYMTMNFGPMNKSGGERRLNVAITRARSELIVFASFHPEQIDLSRTQAVGVRHLKHFMEYAEQGAHALAETIYESVREYESPFEEYVANALIEKGWNIKSQIGVSAFRIDLGVVHPDNSNTYLAGVECDGATYHRSATARDRDKVREQVLRNLGWEILRVWSTDWWIDSNSATEKLNKALGELLEQSRYNGNTRHVANI